MRHTVGRTFGAVKSSWLEMLMSFGVGYYGPDALANLGLGYVAYNNIPMYKTVVDQLYSAAGQTGSTSENPWRDGGVRGWAKAYGVGDAMKTTLSAAKGGGFSRGSLSKLALDLGFIFDGPNDSPGGSGGGGGYWS